jgi:hypothetical protein
LRLQGHVFGRDIEVRLANYWLGHWAPPYPLAPTISALYGSRQISGTAQVSRNPTDKRLSVGQNVAARTNSHCEDRFGIDVAIFEVRRAEDFARAFAALKGRVEAVYVVSDPLMTSNRIRISILSLIERLPTMNALREYVEVGGLISYGPNFQDRWRRAGDYVDKILRGAIPGDLPVEQPTKFDLVINLVTAKALGLTVPDKLLALADELIE